VLGYAKPIVITDTRQFNFVYWGRSIHRIRPETIEVKRLPATLKARYRHHGRHFTPAQSNGS
jgi:hypothetical protein